MSGGLRRVWVQKQRSCGQNEGFDELCSSNPVASTDKPQDLGWEVLPVRVPSVPEGEAECGLGESGSPPHSPITRQRGRTRKEGGLGSCCLTNEGDGGDAEQVIILIYSV